MRVLIVHNRYRSAEPSGENAVVDQESRLLEEAGVDVARCFVDSDAIATWPAWRRASVPAGVVWSRLGSRTVVAAIRRANPDVVHFHNTFPLLSPAAIRAAHALGVATAQTFHNFRPICPSSNGLLRDGRICHDCPGRMPFAGVRHGCYRGSRTATVPLAVMDIVHGRLRTWTDRLDRLIFPSAFAQHEYEAAGWPTERMVVKANTAERLVVADVRPTRSGVVCVGRMRAEKGIDVLIDAWRLLGRHETGLVLLGGGEQEATFRDRAATLDGITFAGQQAPAVVAQRLAESVALVVPSRVPEVFPRVVLEAFAVGTPVLGSRRGVLADLIRDGENGLLFEPDDVADLARAINQAVSDPAALRRMGETARRDFDELYAPEVTTKRLIEIYHDAIEHRRQHPVG